MGAHGQQVHSQLVDVEGELAYRLDGIRVKEHARLARDPADLSDRLDRADLVVRVHDRHEDGIGPEGAPHVVGVDQAAGIHRHMGDLAAVLLQIFHGLQHRVVLDGGSDQMATFLLVGIGGAQYRPVVGFSAPAREVDLFRLSAYTRSDGLPGV